MITTRLLRFCLMTTGLAIAVSVHSGQTPTATGPLSEKRFPPLVVPAGFKATLFACNPLIEYPSVIARGPRAGSLFVAVDYVTGLGTGIERRDETRLLEDTDGDGYADKATVFASGFNSIQGLAYHQGTLYVMHSPYLTALRDLKNTGTADERRDLLVGLGLAPEKDPIRLHNANGVVAGHDGWLYLALGDHGCDVKRPEGDRLLLEGGGILRCRPDGRDLHVFATGLRNIYDVALDQELNVCVRDNENDGGDYKIRVCHSFFGADHGYPYLYHEHPDEALAPLADLGLGSSAGAVCYLETQFPDEYRGSLFCCEWGRAVVRYPLKRSGASCLPPREIDFAAGAPNDPYGFRPTDLVVDRDGSLFISDWADGQRPLRGRGRIYRVSYAGKAEGSQGPRENKLAGLLTLDSESYHERCLAQETIERRGKDVLPSIVEALEQKRLGVRGRLHAVWILTNVEGGSAVEKLFALAKSDPDPRVQAQAVRALADLTDPVLVRHRLDAGPADAAIAERIAALAIDRDPQVQLEAIIALGRLRWTEAPAWIRKHVKQRDGALAHAAQWALRRAGNWPAVTSLLNEPRSGASGPFRAIARRAFAEQYDTELVNGLIERLKQESEADRRYEWAELLARAYKKPASWIYWGFRPPPRPAGTVAWGCSKAIGTALDHALAESSSAVRRDILRCMLREKVPVPIATLGPWLKEERDADIVGTLLAALRDRPGEESRPHLDGVIRDRAHTTVNRLVAVSLFLPGLKTGSDDSLLAAASAVEDGPILAELLRALGARKPRAASGLLLNKLTSANAEVRAAAVAALAELNVAESHAPLQKCLGDGDARVRSAAALAAGKLALRPATDMLLKLVRDADADVRRSSLEALRRLREPRALPLAIAALADADTDLVALACVGELGGPELAGAVAELARRHPSLEILASAGKVLMGWTSRAGLPADQRRKIEQAFAEIHGGSGVLLGWHVLGPLPWYEFDIVTKARAGKSLPTGNDPSPDWRLVLSAGHEARVQLPARAKPYAVWLASCEVHVAEEAKVEFFATVPALATVWLNGDAIHERTKAVVVGSSPERAEAVLNKGLNRILVSLPDGKEKPAEFQLGFRRKSASAELEKLARAALARAGNPERGRQVFLHAEKSLCIKCHRLGEQGDRVGPDLTGLGSRFSKAYIVESILEPGRTVAPSFETTLVALRNGKVLSGMKAVETGTSITLVDHEAKKHVLVKEDIETQKKQAGSAMPDGVEKRLTEDEFVDLIAFLTSLKETRGR